MSERIPEPFVKCSFCNTTVKSEDVIRAKQLMIIGKESFPAGTTICINCLKERGAKIF